jgi:hypothetical protein
MADTDFLTHRRFLEDLSAPLCERQRTERRSVLRNVVWLGGALVARMETPGRSRPSPKPWRDAEQPQVALPGWVKITQIVARMEPNASTAMSPP